VVSCASQEANGSASGPSLSRIAVMVVTAHDGGHAYRGCSNARVSWPWSNNWNMPESRAGRELLDAVITPRPPKDSVSVAWSQW
jgi:hypothetical protein